VEQLFDSHSKESMTTDRGYVDEMNDVIALIPAAGEAKRFGRLPCSKEMLPIGTQYDESLLKHEPKVLISHLLDHLREASIKKAYIILKKGKWDIPNYIGDGSGFGFNVGYLIRNLPYGVPFTLEQAFPFVRNNLVALGFADTVYNCSDMFPKMLEKLDRGISQIVLGLFPADETGNADRVEIDDKGVVSRIICKPEKSDAPMVWATAVWKPGFTNFMHRYVTGIDVSTVNNEIDIGHVVQASIEKGITVEGVQVSSHPPFDVGNIDALQHLWEIRR
jgi:glucose-1-phosphate thymidylyltransferase